MGEDGGGGWVGVSIEDGRWLSLRVLGFSYQGSGVLESINRY